MATAEQKKLRRDRILEFVALMHDEGLDIKKIPYNFRSSVLAAALAEGVVAPENVPPKLAKDVALRFLKEASIRERDDAADRGTEVHALIEKMSNGEIVDVPDDLLGHVEAWRQWRRDWMMTFVETEFTVFSPTHYYAGTGDFLARSGLHPEMGLILGDVKTSRSGIWPDIALQLAALRYADFIGRDDLSEDRSVLKRIDTCVGVQITGEGYKVVKVNVSEPTFQVFLAALHIARWKRDYEQFALEHTEEFVKTGASR